jgi:hypothetical protein
MTNSYTPHPTASYINQIVIQSRETLGYRRLIAGEVRLVDDVYPGLEPVYDFTVGWTIAPGDMIFRKVLP